MSGLSLNFTMGRVVDKPKPKEVLINGVMTTIWEMRVVVNTWQKTSSIGTFYYVTLWPRWKNMIQFLEKGKAVICVGEVYMSKYKNSEGGVGSRLVIELSHLKFCLQDSRSLSQSPLEKKIENAENLKNLEEEEKITKELFEKDEDETVDSPLKKVKISKD
eukprot:NODE_475_length_6994_cov_1.213198.p3 type:complete len:161 gc:universal NODE_475_length_6994_cov_1.213198:291-773(+)